MFLPSFPSCCKEERSFSVPLMPKIPCLESATTMVCPWVGWQGLHHHLHSPSNPVMDIWGRISMLSMGTGHDPGSLARQSAGGAHSSLRVAVLWHLGVCGRRCLLVGQTLGGKQRICSPNGSGHPFAQVSKEANRHWGGFPEMVQHSKCLVGFPLQQSSSAFPAESPQ